jgi:hypothetical protein
MNLADVVDEVQEEDSDDHSPVAQHRGHTALPQISNAKNAVVPPTIDIPEDKEIVSDNEEE